MRIEDPAILRQRLRRVLRQARIQANLTQRETADALNWSPSKLLRIENGENSITPGDLDALLRRYGVGGRHYRELTALGRQVAAARRDGRAHVPYADIESSEYWQYLELERTAARIRTFEQGIMPGLLQTEEYARAVLEAYGHAGTSLERTIAGQVERTARLLRDDAPTMYFILDEAALHRAVGDDLVMQGQLNWLAELAERPTISIGVVSLPEPDRPDVERLSILEFEGERPTYAVYSDGPDGPMLDTTDFAGAERHLDLFSQLAEMASPKEGLDRRFLPVAA